MKKEDFAYIFVVVMFFMVIIWIINEISEMKPYHFNKVVDRVIVKRVVKSTNNNNIDDVDGVNDNEEINGSKSLPQKTKKIVLKDKDLSKKEKDGIPAKFIKENHLPPYPGKDGGAGILGTDSNNNGIRDDVERKIYWHYRKYPQDVRMVFLKEAQIYNKFLEIALDIKKGEFAEESYMDIEREFSNVSTCSTYYEEKKGNKDIVFRSVINIKQRQELYIYLSLYVKKHMPEESLLELWDQATDIESQILIEEGKYDNERMKEFCSQISLDP